MFEAVCAFLLRLYPARFRRAYGDDARQLIRDRARHERGVLLRLRLVMDLTMDLLATSVSWQPAAAVFARVDGTPRFDFIETHRPRPEALAAGMLTSMLMFAGFALLFQPRTFPSAPAQLGKGSGADPAALESGDSAQRVASDPGERHSLIAAIAENLKQRYVDRAVGQQLADALLAYEKNGRYDSVSSGSELADRITDDIHGTSRSIGIPAGAFVADVVYSERPLPIGPPPPMTAEMRERNRARMLEQNCLFQTIETLPHNVGYVKLNGFAEASACQETASRAMASVNNVDALIVDLRDNGGGFGDTALQIAGYLFDRPTYLYDPRPHSPVPSHTASPMPGNTLVDKPVYVLTSSRTQSAAEYFVYNLKMLKRVTLVGEKTAGHQHSGAFHRINDHFGMGIQETSPPLNPYSVKGWEVIGVEPDVTVSSAEALEVATTLAESQPRRR
jgi:Peptidase family S41